MAKTRLEVGRDILKQTLGDAYYAQRVDSTNSFNGACGA